MIRNRLYGMLPDFVAEYILEQWRALYWWNKGRIRPARNRRVARNIVRTGLPIKLELGSWKRIGMEDWVTTDINGNGDLQLDLSQPIPFPDNAIEKIYSSHLIEHFSYPSPMLNLLRECNRILKPGGVFSVAVPNARIFLDAYMDDSDFDREKYCAFDVGLSYKTRIDYVNFVAHMGGEHRHLFDEDNLLMILEEAGFSHVKLREFDPSMDREDRRHDSVYAQGRK